VFVIIRKLDQIALGFVKLINLINKTITDINVEVNKKE